MIKRRHTVAEIAGKLEKADSLFAQGRLHGEIAKSLGVSVMTYHRWRKARESPHLAVRSQMGGAEIDASPNEQTKRIGELRLENARLRRLVTDLLLEKMSLEEGIHGRSADVNSAARR